MNYRNWRQPCNQHTHQKTEIFLTPRTFFLLLPASTAPLINSISACDKTHTWVLPFCRINKRIFHGELLCPASFTQHWNRSCFKPGGTKGKWRLFVQDSLLYQGFLGLLPAPFLSTSLVCTESSTGSKPIEISQLHIFFFLFWSLILCASSD